MTISPVHPTNVIVSSRLRIPRKCLEPPTSFPRSEISGLGRNWPASRVVEAPVRRLLVTVLLSSCAGNRAALYQLLSVRNMEPGDSCPRWSDLRQVERLECEAVPELLSLLTDKTLLEGYSNFGAGVTVGAMAFFALGEMDNGLWAEVAYAADQPLDGVFGFLATMRESPETIRDAVVRRGVKCRARRPQGARVRQDVSRDRNR